MRDFRAQLYERYASTFKDDARAIRSDADVESYWSVCRHKILPLIADVDRRTPVLELGCGLGGLMWILEREGFADVHGVDASSEMVALAKEADLSVEQGDALTFLEASDKRYGLIVALDFVEHFSKEELMRLFPAIRERLLPGGTLLIQTPNGEGLLPNRVVYGDLTHLTTFTPGSLTQLLRINGFGNISFFETGPAPKSFRGIVRVALWSAIKAAANVVKLIETGATQEIWTENLICRCRRQEGGPTPHP